MVSQHALQQVSRGGWYPSMPCSRSPGGGGIPACLAGLQAHTRGGKLRGLPWGVSRPTPRGEVKGSGMGGLQVHTRGRGVIQAHTWGVSQHALRQTPPVPSTHPTGMHSCYDLFLQGQVEAMAPLPPLDPLLKS